MERQSKIRSTLRGTWQDDEIEVLMQPLREQELDFTNPRHLMRIQGRYYELSDQ